MQPKCSSVDEWIKKTRYIYTMEYSVHFSHCCDCLFATSLTACSMPRFPVHQLLEFVQIHVHRVSDAIQPSNSLLSPTPSAFSLFQHWLHGPQHTRLPCPSTPRACSNSNSCPLSRWCHPTISSSVVNFSSCLQSFPATGSFPVNQFFTSGGQRIGVSASASMLPRNIQDWFPLG